MGPATLCPAAVVRPADEQARWPTCCCRFPLAVHLPLPGAADSRQPVRQEAEPARSRRSRHKTMPAQLAEGDSRVLLPLPTRRTRTTPLRILRMTRLAGRRMTRTGLVHRKEGSLKLEDDRGTMKHHTRRRMTKVSSRHTRHTRAELEAQVGFDTTRMTRHTRHMAQSSLAAASRIHPTAEEVQSSPSRGRSEMRLVHHCRRTQIAIADHSCWSGCCSPSQTCYLPLHCCVWGPACSARLAWALRSQALAPESAAASETHRQLDLRGTSLARRLRSNRGG